MNLTPLSDPNTAIAPEDENQLMLERREKLRALRELQAQGAGVAFPNDFKPADRAEALFAAHGGQTSDLAFGHRQLSATSARRISLVPSKIRLILESRTMRS